MWGTLIKCLRMAGILVLIVSLMTWLMPSIARGDSGYTITITAPDGSTSSYTTSDGSIESSLSSVPGPGCHDSYPGPGYHDPLYNQYLPLPPYQPTTHHSSGSSSGSGSAETVVKSTDVTGKGWTVMREVNVRSLPSTKSRLVRQISSKQSEVSVNTEVLNSAGETWYGVKLYSGHVGYIRGDLLDVDIEKVDSSESDDSDSKKSTASADASAAAGKDDASNPKPSESMVIVYVVTVPEGQVVQSAKKDGVFIYLTPEEAENLGLVTVSEAEAEDYAVETEDHEPING